MSTAIGWFFIVLLALLCLVEWGRYRRAARQRDELPYSRRRLVRRYLVAVLFAGSIALLCYWPKIHWALQLACLLGVLAAMCAGLVLLWIDLHETSLLVLAHSARMSSEAGESLKQWLEEQPAAKQTPEAPPRPKP